MRGSLLAALLLGALLPGAALAERWRGLEVRPEERCSPYESDDYSYSQSAERGIQESLGGIWSPYTGECFRSLRETDIEHVVARSEAHDSGLCASLPEMQRAFSEDPLNLTLASPGLNRQAKKAHDASGWLPERNRCWFAAKVVFVKRKWGLSVDARERDVLEGVISECSWFGIERPACAGERPPGS